MAISDDTLMAYLDNELSAEERARVDASLAGDAALRDRLHQQRAVRDVLRSAFGPIVHENVPPHLAQAALTAPVSLRYRMREHLSRLSFGAQGDRFVPFARLASGAAVLLIGIAIGWVMARGPVGADSDAAGAIAQGPLARALEQQLAADVAQQGPRVGVSFRAKSGQLCRSFDLGAIDGNKAGIACRSLTSWSVEMLVAAEPRATSPYETAASAMPPVVSAALNDLIAGAPLNAEQERLARSRGWRP